MEATVGTKTEKIANSKSRLHSDVIEEKTSTSDFVAYETGMWVVFSQTVYKGANDFVFFKLPYYSAIVS